MSRPVNTVCMLIAQGPNDLEIPCRLFSSEPDAQAWMRSKFGEPKRENFWSVREDNPEVEALFTYYYGGCGGVGGLLICQVSYDTPFLGWSLD